MTKVSLDPAVNLDMYLRRGRDGVKEFRFLESGEPFLLVDDFELKSDIDISLVVEDNKLTLLVNGEDTVNARYTYYYQIVNTTKNQTWFCGTLYFTDTTKADFEQSEDVNIILEEVVEVTINLSSED
jgi:hypothetical protein